MAAVPGESPGVVGEAEAALCGFVDDDHEAHAVGPTAGKAALGDKPGRCEGDQHPIPASVVVVSLLGRLEPGGWC